MSNRSKNVQVAVKGSIVWIGIDTAKPCGELTKSEKSTIVGATDGMARVQVDGKTFKVSAFMCEALPAASRYEAEVKRVAGEMVKTGMEAKLADATARKIVKAPKTPAPDASAKSEASAAVRKGVGEGAPAPASETPAPVVPPAQPSAKGKQVKVNIHPKA